MNYPRLRNASCGKISLIILIVWLASSVGIASAQQSDVIRQCHAANIDDARQEETDDREARHLIADRYEEMARKLRRAIEWSEQQVVANRDSVREVYVDMVAAESAVIADVVCYAVVTVAAGAATGGIGAAAAPAVCTAWTALRITIGVVGANNAVSASTNATKITDLVNDTSGAPVVRAAGKVIEGARKTNPEENTSTQPSVPINSEFSNRETVSNDLEALKGASEIAEVILPNSRFLPVVSPFIETILIPQRELPKIRALKSDRVKLAENIRRMRALAEEWEAIAREIRPKDYLENPFDLNADEQNQCQEEEPEEKKRTVDLTSLRQKIIANSDELSQQQDVQGRRMLSSVNSGELYEATRITKERAHTQRQQAAFGTALSIVGTAATLAIEIDTQNRLTNTPYNDACVRQIREWNSGRYNNELKQAEATGPGRLSTVIGLRLVSCPQDVIQNANAAAEKLPASRRACVRGPNNGCP